MADVLGSFEQAVLLAVLWLGEGAFGSAVFREVETRLDRDVAAGAVHATLVRLERKGMLVSRAPRAPQIRAGRPRRYYAITAPGRVALNGARAATEQLWRGLVWPLPMSS
jgi:DNA-binding PadR family transcriptional regulator